MNRPGRNDPCHCGSGRKYKHCCLRADSESERPAPASGLGAELQRALQDHEFESMEQVQAFAADFMRQRNDAPRDDFHGLSPTQMQRLLGFAFESPDLLVFADRLDITPEAPVARLMDLLVEAIGEKGLKATATGNLPRKFCQDAALAFEGEEAYRERTSIGRINTELDFWRMHLLRITATEAGLIRKHKGRFVLSREARRLIAANDSRALYPKLFRTYTTRFNWAYGDRYESLGIIQQSFAFTLYLLHRYGDTERSQDFYEDAFVRAFPAALSEAGQSPYTTPYTTAEDSLRRCYTLRAMERFAAFFGLIDLRVIREESFGRNFRMRRAPLLDHVVQFRR